MKAKIYFIIVPVLFLGLMTLAFSRSLEDNKEFFLHTKYKVAGIPISKPITDLHRLKEFDFMGNGRVKKAASRSSYPSIVTFGFDSILSEKEARYNKAEAFSLSESQKALQIETACDIFSCLWQGQLTLYAKKFSEESNAHRERDNALFGWSFDPLLDVLLGKFVAASKEASKNKASENEEANEHTPQNPSILSYFQPPGSLL